MPSPHFERKAKEALGDDAGRELGAMMERIDPIRGDIAELRQTLLATDSNFKQAMLAMELRLTDKLAALDSKIAEKYSGLLKWSFVFWVGAVAAIAALAGVLRR